MSIAVMVVGGIETAIWEVPYQVTLTYDGRLVCGGSIIAPYLIIIAAQ